MGLAQRKEKQRIGYDPRNLTWANDKDRFSLKHMSKLGWEEGSGIGKDASGRSTHIAVMRKMDNTGIGMGRAKKEGDELSAGAGQAGAGLEDVLKRLASRKNTPSTCAEPYPASTPVESSPGPSSIRNKMASRQRHLHSKRLASQSPAALAEILGVPVSSLPATPTESPSASGASTPAAKESSPEATPTPAESDGEPQRLSLETITTSKMSVSDYFRQKLREKALARQAASGSSTPAPALSAGSLAVMEEVKITQDGVGWEGTKMKFEEVETELADLGPEYERPGEGSSSSSSAGSTEEPKEKKKSKGKEKASDDDKAAKKARKEEKRAKKEGKEEKKRRKEEKKAAKTEKEAKKEGKEKKDKKRKRDDEKDGEDDDKKRKSKSKKD